jgi:RimJ/RimL family protein N-acetyltransferase
MLTDDALRTKPTLHGQRVVLRPLGPEHAEVFWRSLADPEIRQLTGTHTEFDRDQIDVWLADRSEHHDRLDCAIHRRTDDLYLGELALIELDPDNETVSVRIALTSSRVIGKGYGSDALRTILTHAFDTVGLHRVHLDVYAFNTDAIGRGARAPSQPGEDAARRSLRMMSACCPLESEVGLRLAG